MRGISYLRLIEASSSSTDGAVHGAIAAKARGAVGDRGLDGLAGIPPVRESTSTNRGMPPDRTMAATRRAGAKAGQMTSSPTFKPTESIAASSATPAVVAATA